jgi:transketolase
MTTTTSTSQMTDLDTVGELAAQLRVDSIRSSTSAGSGHPTSSMSAADLLAVLVTGTCATTGMTRGRPPTTT